MGSIQSLRSWALSSRANEDTDVQISGFLGNVNKSLGRQIVGILDQLQGVISERTKAYNNLVSSINRTIDGKGGIAEKSILGVFSGIRFIFSIVGIAISQSADAATLIGLVTSAIGNALTGLELEASINGAIYDYEKMASQLGYMKISAIPTDAPGVFEESGLETGASRFLDMRDGLMPRYNRQVDLNNKPAGYQFHGSEGFVGTLRRN